MQQQRPFDKNVIIKENEGLQTIAISEFTLKYIFIEMYNIIILNLIIIYYVLFRRYSLYVDLTIFSCILCTVLLARNSF